MGKIIDITNQVFGRLTALEVIGKDKRGEKIWKCKCQCGKEVQVLSSNLRSGKTQSCGCFRREVLSGEKENLIKDLTGQVFGFLTVIEKTSERLNGQVVWKCKCKCGKEHKVGSYNLTSGSTWSCGCYKKSHGELLIEKLLMENNIPYETEKIFSSCKFEESQQYARFDFYVNNSYIIEFDGEQHFTYSNKGWNTKENFKKRQERDKYKNNWCRENNIPIIRIPYTHEKNINISDLLLDSSVFILKD